MQNNKQKKNKDEQVIIEIPRIYIQDFVEANYGRKLTEAELKELRWLVWDNSDEYLLYWISEAVDQIMLLNQKRYE